MAGMDIVQLIEALGGLHDAEIVSLIWMPGKAEALMSFDDINSNLEGLPEYQGPIAASFIFSGVAGVEWTVDRPDRRLKIFEWNVQPNADGFRSEIRISPSGRLIIQCADIARRE
jgi:hypothetical protein